MDTNVFIAALRSKRGAAYRLLSLIDSGKFVVTVSVPLIFEYESVAKSKRTMQETGLNGRDIDDLLDYICQVSERRRVHYLWRPFLKDPKDDMVLELAIEAECDAVVTYNIADFGPATQFGLQVMTPRDFLQKIGELS